MVPSSTSKSSTSLSRWPKILAKLTATEVTPCNRLEPERLCETRLPQALAMVAVIRAVVVLPLLPVITIFFALLAPMTDFSILGSMRRATMPGKLVPPLTRSKRPVLPTSFPAEIASANRALPRPDGALILPLLCSIPSFTITMYTSLIVIFYELCRVQYNKMPGQGQARLSHIRWHVFVFISHWIVPCSNCWL